MQSDFNNRRSLGDIYRDSSTSSSIKELFKEPAMLYSLNKDILSNAPSSQGGITLYSLRGTELVPGTVEREFAARWIAFESAKFYTEKDGSHFYDPRLAISIWGNYASSTLEGKDKENFNKYLSEVAKGDKLFTIVSGNILDPTLARNGFDRTYSIEISDPSTPFKDKQFIIAPPEILKLLAGGKLDKGDFTQLQEFNELYRKDEAFRKDLQIVEAILPQSSWELGLNLGLGAFTITGRVGAAVRAATLGTAIGEFSLLAGDITLAAMLGVINSPKKLVSYTFNNAHSWDTLVIAAKNSKGVQGSKEWYKSEDLIDIIEGIQAGRRSVGELPRTAGRETALPLLPKNIDEVRTWEDFYAFARNYETITGKPGILRSDGTLLGSERLVQDIRAAQLTGKPHTLSRNEGFRGKFEDLSARDAKIPSDLQRSDFVEVPFNSYRPLPDGYAFEGTSGWNAREVILIDRRIDPTLSSFLEETAEKAKSIRSEEKQMKVVFDEVTSAIRGEQEITYIGGAVRKMGEYLDQCTGVCRHRAPLLKMAYDEVGIQSRLMRGSIDGNPNRRHVWVEVELNNGQRYIADPMWGTIDSINNPRGRIVDPIFTLLAPAAK